MDKKRKDPVAVNAERAVAQAKKAAALEFVRVKRAHKLEIDKISAEAKRTHKVEIDKMKADMAKLKTEFERDRVRAQKLNETVAEKARKDIERAVERQKRAERAVIDKSSVVVERARQIASLRMELNRERVQAAMAASQVKPVAQPIMQQTSPQIPQTNAEFALAQIHQMLAELVVKTRAVPVATPTCPVSAVQAPVQPAFDANMLTDALRKMQQETMLAQFSTAQTQQQQQARIDELMRKQHEAEVTLETTTPMTFTEHEPSHDPSVEEVSDSLNDAIESRGGVAPSSTPHLDEYAEAPQIQSQPEIEFVRANTETIPAEQAAGESSVKEEGDPLDALILNLKKELDSLKTQINKENERDKKKKY